MCFLMKASEERRNALKYWRSANHLQKMHVLYFRVKVRVAAQVLVRQICHGLYMGVGWGGRKFD